MTPVTALITAAVPFGTPYLFLRGPGRQAVRRAYPRQPLRRYPYPPPPCHRTALAAGLRKLPAEQSRDTVPILLTQVVPRSAAEPFAGSPEAIRCSQSPHDHPSSYRWIVMPSDALRRPVRQLGEMRRFPARTRRKLMCRVESPLSAVGPRLSRGSSPHAQNTGLRTAKSSKTNLAGDSPAIQPQPNNKPAGQDTPPARPSRFRTL